MAYNFLPGTFQELIDGNLQQVSVNKNPVTTVLGTASRGDSYSFYRVESSSDAAGEYGRGEGTLMRGLYENSAGGGKNLRLMRIGAQAAVLSGIGALASDPDIARLGFTIETNSQDEDAGDDYSVFYEAANGGLRIKRVVDGVLVYDNSPGVPLSYVDLGEITISGVADLGYAIGTIQCIPFADLLDGETVTIDDGVNLAVTFHVSTDGSYEPGGGYDAQNVELDITGLVTAIEIADALRVLITAAALDVTVDVAGTDIITVTNDLWGTVGNVDILEDVADVGFLVTGMVCQQTSDIGTASVFVVLSAAVDAHGVSEGPGFVAGGDGLALSRMALYEALHNGYSLLEDQDIDYVQPMNIFLDDLNVMDLTEAQITSRNITLLSDYPVQGAQDDALGLLHTEEYEGRFYFWWHIPAEPTSIAASPVANIFPTVGSADATHGVDGTVLESADYHEVNFGYQLANFLYVQSTNNETMNGFIGVKAPQSYSLRDISLWIGQSPELVEDNNGNVVVEINGSGLLGNKWLAGRVAVATPGLELPGFAIDNIDGLSNGGFILTDSGEIDGIHQKDSNDKLIDIGKYLSVVQAQVRMSNPTSTTPYIASYASMYAGLCSTLLPNSAPTNKPVVNASLPYRVNKTKLDTLAGLRYIALHARKRNLVVADAPTAARPESDYARFSTFAQVKAAVDAVREVAEPFLGEGMSGTLLAALETAIGQALKALVKVGVLVAYDFQLISTPLMRTRGQAITELILVPAFEFRQLTIRVALAAAL